MKQLTQRDWQKIDEVMENFDFELLHKAIKVLYEHIPEDKDGFKLIIDVPSVYELKDIARKLLKEVIEEDLRLCATRYLKVTKISYTDFPNDYELWLEFDCLSYFSEAIEQPKKKNKRKHKK